jgi:hypothetical protein
MIIKDEQFGFENHKDSKLMANTFQTLGIGHTSLGRLFPSLVRRGAA